MVIRISHDSDVPALRRLAELDCAAAPRGPMLLAEADGELRAAYSEQDGTVIADPFHPTAHLVALLDAHAHDRITRRGHPATGPGLSGLRRRAPWPA